MQETLNYRLKKPEHTDFYNVDDNNYNADAIDAKLKDLDDNKQEKVPGKDLSENDLTAALKKKYDDYETDKQGKNDNSLQTTSKNIVGAINENKSSLADIATEVAGKVNKVEGKDLSTHDLTNELKTQYDGYEQKINILSEDLKKKDDVEMTVGDTSLIKSLGQNRDTPGCIKRIEGRTLVNHLNISNKLIGNAVITGTIINLNGTHVSFDLTSLINKDFIIYVFASNNTANYTIHTLDSGDTNLVTYLNKTGNQKLQHQAISNLNKIRFYSNAGQNVDLKVVILERNNINIDIPYFEGVRSARDFELVSVGENLIDTKTAYYDRSCIAIKLPKLKIGSTYTVNSNKSGKLLKLAKDLYSDSLTSDTAFDGATQPKTFTYSESMSSMILYIKGLTESDSDDFEITLSEGTESKPYKKFDKSTISSSDFLAQFEEKDRELRDGDYIENGVLYRTSLVKDSADYNSTWGYTGDNGDGTTRIYTNDLKTPEIKDINFIIYKGKKLIRPIDFDYTSGTYLWVDVPTEDYNAAGTATGVIQNNPITMYCTLKNTQQYQLNKLPIHSAFENGTMWYEGKIKAIITDSENWIADSMASGSNQYLRFRLTQSLANIDTGNNTASSTPQNISLNINDETYEITSIDGIYNNDKKSFSVFWNGHDVLEGCLTVRVDKNLLPALDLAGFKSFISTAKVAVEYKPKSWLHPITTIKLSQNTAGTVQGLERGQEAINKEQIAQWDEIDRARFELANEIADNIAEFERIDGELVMVKQRGVEVKNGYVDAINSIDPGSASTNNTHEQLWSIIRAISVGELHWGDLWVGSSQNTSTINFERLLAIPANSTLLAIYGECKKSADSFYDFKYMAVRTQLATDGSNTFSRFIQGSGRDHTLASDFTLEINAITNDIKIIAPWNNTGYCTTIHYLYITN